MYYITNQNNQIIAIDPSLSALLKVENIDELYKGVALGEITFSSSTEDGKVTIATNGNEETFNVENHDLSSMLGDITLVQVQISSKESTYIADDISTFILEDDEALSIEKEESVEDLLNLDIDTEEEISLLHDDMISIKDTDETLTLEDSEEAEEESTDEEENEDLLSLLLPEDEDTIDEISPVEEEEAKAVEEDLSPIIIDIKNISQSIGISTKDYNIFLNEYIDTALSLEKDLQSTQEEKRTSAIGTLSHLSNVLHLPVISKMITQIENATADTQDTYIESFYATLARLTTSQVEIATEEISPIVEIDSEVEAQAVESLDIDSIDLFGEEPQTVEEPETVTTTEGFGTINLDEVKPIHFDFQLEEAAKDLSLPVELIEEFVHDFVVQGHTETEKMLAAYERGDLKTIQEIGHLLKGTSSNLRINPLADTLYEIQFCEDSSKLEDMIKHYWGHFLSLETQINITSKK